MGFDGLAASAPLLLVALLLDAIAGDPQYPFHPIRLIGRTLAAMETMLRRIGLSGYGGGCLLFLLLSSICVLPPALFVQYVYGAWPGAGVVAHVVLVYALFALRDLIDHTWEIQKACRREDLIGARSAVARVVGRDTRNMDFAACRRAGIESLAENFVDAFVSPLFWYALLGVPGILVFKVVSTMDSMVGYKTATYHRFGWCGACLDDLMNYVPARLAWLLLGLAATFFPSLSALKGWRIGLEQHSLIPGPNPGWSEATMAGLLQRRLIGPIFKGGSVVTTVWVGEPQDPEGGKDRDLTLAIRITVLASLIAGAVGFALLTVG